MPAASAVAVKSAQVPPAARVVLPVGAPEASNSEGPLEDWPKGPFLLNGPVTRVHWSPEAPSTPVPV